MTPSDTPAAAPIVPTRAPTRLRLAEWRRNPALCSEAAKLINSPIFQTMLEIMAIEHPKNWQMLDVGNRQEDLTLRLGRIYGYDMALNNLEQFTIPERTRVKAEAAFLSEPKPEQPPIPFKPPTINPKA